jgi:hypothetical protein
VPVSGEPLVEQGQRQVAVADAAHGEPAAVAGGHADRCEPAPPHVLHWDQGHLVVVEGVVHVVALGVVPTEHDLVVHAAERLELAVAHGGDLVEAGRLAAPLEPLLGDHLRVAESAGPLHDVLAHSGWVLGAADRLDGVAQLGDGPDRVRAVGHGLALAGGVASLVGGDGLEAVEEGEVLQVQRVFLAWRHAEGAGVETVAQPLRVAREVLAQVAHAPVEVARGAPPDLEGALAVDPVLGQTLRHVAGHSKRGRHVPPPCAL